LACISGIVVATVWSRSSFNGRRHERASGCQFSAAVYLEPVFRILLALLASNLLAFD
jgi:hypothetical protein